MKRFCSIVLIIVIAAALVLSAVACDKAPAAKTLAEIYTTDTQDLPTIGDYRVADNFNIDTVRFAFWSPATGWVEDAATAPFDESRPTVIHAHGQGADGYMFTPSAYYDAGYNVMSFLWGSLSDDGDVLEIEPRIWDSINSFDADTSGDRNIIEAVNPDGCTVPELYAARYCDFFALHKGYDQPIHLTGHSYGGQLTMALATYLTTLYRQNRLPAGLLPDRYTMLDPYFDPYPLEFNCHWLGDDVKVFRRSSLSAAIYCLENVLLPNNVAIELLRTSDAVELAMAMALIPSDTPAPDYYTEFLPLVRVVELANQDELTSQFDNPIEGIGFRHTIANDFYFSPNALPLYSDAAGTPVFGRENSASLMLATVGMHFDLWIDEVDYKQYQNVRVARTVEDPDPDYVDEDAAPNAKEVNLDPDYTVIAGLVATDRNGNGKVDEAAAARLEGVSVTLKGKDGKQQTCTVGGYYSFEVKRGETYTVTVSAANYKTVKKEIKADSYVNLLDFALAAK